MADAAGRRRPKPCRAQNAGRWRDGTAVAGGASVRARSTGGVRRCSVGGACICPGAGLASEPGACAGKRARRRAAMSRYATAGFDYVDGALQCEGVPLARIAQQWGTPTYVYSKRVLLESYHRYVRALAGRPALVCYAMKANSNLALLELLARAGSGFDIVSGGELARALAVGAAPGRIVFSGVGKSAAEIEAALDAGIACFNVESAPELERISAIARRRGQRAPVSLRINPDVDARTHPYISTGLKSNKFGIAADDALPLYRHAAALPGIEVAGIDCHIGSQITTVEPYLDAAERILDLVDALQRHGIGLRHIDLGGGLGIRYRDEAPPPIESLVGALLACIDRRGHGDKQLLLEPGRSIVGDAGVLLTRVEYLKTGAQKHFAIVDAAMNDLLRPALYDAWMDVRPVQPRAGAGLCMDIVGPVCESGDWLARERTLALVPGDLLALSGAGAYGMSMASNYNSRGRPAEVIVDGAAMHLVRAREDFAQLVAGERVLPR